MYKIKTFRQDVFSMSLDAQFNEWSKENPEIVILDLKYQVTNSGQYICVGYDDCNVKD